MLLLRASRAVGTVPTRLRPAAAHLSSLPSNLKLADPDLLNAKPKPSHQVVSPDPPRSVRDRNAAFVFQRPGVLNQQIQVPVLSFAASASSEKAAAADADPATPPPPPELLTLNPRVFGLPLRLDILQTVVKWQLACRRSGTGSTKRIGDVRGSGRKLRPQKGGGRARVGHSRPPQFKGGAKAHGPPTGGRDWSYTINKKERRLALATALSQKLAEGNLVVVDGVGQDSHLTKDLGAKISKLMGQAQGSGPLSVSALPQTMVVVEDGVVNEASHSHPTAEAVPVSEHPQEDQDNAVKFLLACQNLSSVHVMPQLGCNVYDLLRREKVVISARALKLLEARLATPVRRKPWDSTLASTA